jgi:hypothetical protein
LPCSNIPHIILSRTSKATVRQFLSFINGSIDITDLSIPSLQRSNDFYLMDTALNSNRFASAEICKVNLCRLFLSVTTVSNICNARGSHLITGIRTGEPSATPSLPKGPTVKQKTDPTKRCGLYGDASCPYSATTATDSTNHCARGHPQGNTSDGAGLFSTLLCSTYSIAATTTPLKPA